MSTIYTVNNKVLKNSANDKWLTKKEAPAGFVMNASNAIFTATGPTNTNIYISWQSPSYPDGYQGVGKQYILINNNPEAATSNNPFMYGAAVTGGGPDAIRYNDMKILGTSTGTLLNNPVSSSYGMYLTWALTNYTLEQAQAYMANVSITIVDL